MMGREMESEKFKSSYQNHAFELRGLMYRVPFYHRVKVGIVPNENFMKFERHGFVFTMDTNQV